jgi:hypothetical protein
MTSSDDADPAAETAIGPPAADVTEIVPPDQASTLAAWSLCDDTEVLQKQRPWPLAAGIAAGSVVGTALLAGAVCLTAWAPRPAPSTSSGRVTLTQMLPPPPLPVTVTAAPPITKTWTPAPSTTTVTVRAAPQPEPSAADPGGSVNDEAFLDALRRVKINVSNTAEAIFGAHLVCGELRDGYSQADVITAVKGRNPALTALGAVDFVADSVVYYCPQYEG